MGPQRLEAAVVFLLHDSEQDFGANEIDQVVEPNIAERSLAAVDFGRGAAPILGSETAARSSF